VAKVHVTLGDGFDNDRVRMRVNGREVFAKDGVRTQLAVGTADFFDLELPPGPAEVEVALDNRKLRQSFPLEVTDGLQVAVYLDEGRLQLASGKNVGFA
jgi:hypothetical protein